ncbi:MAG: glycosyl transferase, partial [Betaproteobacteria bacterium]
WSLPGVAGSATASCARSSSCGGCARRTRSARIRIGSPHSLLAVVAVLLNARSRWTGIATGDQAVFVRRDAFEAAGGFPSIPLMEDVALSRALKRLSPPAALRLRVVTSGRRWERHGILRTIFLMWRLRAAYALGADPHRLARRYGVERTSC